ncbi:MAG: type II toxin-antitoxin system VapC family toxin [Solirubrobacteraceae bacterium]
MRLLLDTHLLIWQQEGRLDLIGRATETIEAADELLVSVISFVEIGIKVATGKLRMPAGIRDHVLHSGARLLNLSPEHGLGIAELPLHHRDPFDRLLISQARSEGLAIVTADPRFARYDVRVVRAGA